MASTEQHDRVEAASQTETPVDETQQEDQNEPGALSKMGSLPWWVISFVVHAILLLLATLIIVSSLKPEDLLANAVSVSPLPPPPPKIDQPKEVTLEKRAQVNLDAKADRPFYHAGEPGNRQGSGDGKRGAEQRVPRAGQQDAVSTIPAEGTGTIVSSASAPAARRAPTAGDRAAAASGWRAPRAVPRKANRPWTWALNG